LFPQQHGGGMSDLYYLYHLRDPETSAGYGNDGYLGITDDPARRLKEHNRAGTRGTHRNANVQTMYDRASGPLQMHLVKTGTREEVLATEALLVRGAKMHANIQPGGGPLRGKDIDELFKLSGAGKPRTKYESRSAVPMPSSQAALTAIAVIVVAGGVYYLYRRLRDKKDQPHATENDVPVYMANDWATKSPSSAEELAIRDQGYEALRLQLARLDARKYKVSYTKSMTADEIFSAVNKSKAQMRWYRKVIDFFN
jgi:predicted GIY-YIG superfamily endonuclease